MKVVGSIASLEKEIRRKYESDLRKLEKEAKQRIEKIRSTTRDKLKAIRERNKPRINRIKETSKRAALNEVKMKWKLEYQREKEKMANTIINEIRKDLRKIAHSKSYLDYLKRKMPKGNFEVYADSNYYQKLFKKKIKIDRSITGVRLIGKDVVYDFTLESILNAKMPRIKMVISKVLK